MTRILRLVVGLLLLYFTGCHDAEVNMSKLNISNLDNFEIKAIHQTPEGQIVCIGTSDSGKVIRQYSQNFKLLKEFDLSEYFDESLQLQVVKTKEGFLISEMHKENVKSIVTLYQTDESLNIIKEHVLLDKIVGLYAFSGFVLDLSQLDNGDYLVVWDSTIQRSSYDDTPNLGISRFDASFHLRYKYIDFPVANYDNFYALRAKALELQDGSIEYVVWFKTTPFAYGEDNLLLGRIGVDGFSMYQTTPNLEVTKSFLNGFSISENYCLIHRSGEFDERQIYTFYDLNTGALNKRISLPLGVKNMVNSPNHLPIKLDVKAGHFLESYDKGYLQYFKVGFGVGVESQFKVHLPRYTSLMAYRSIISKSGTIILGASFNDDQGNQFVLQELTKGGDFVR